jgi:hypothetical protein
MAFFFTPLCNVCILSFNLQEVNIMAFPLTHLCVAYEILPTHLKNEKDAAQFLLGSISPDAIHYREEFQGAAMSNIGPAKKITHLCPISDERWGQVTNNEGWCECVKDFLHEKKSRKDDAFAKGYAVHVLTDIHNNRTIWNDFRTNHPAEAAKGYKSEYYADMRNIDIRLYQEYPHVAEIFALLEQATPTGIPGLVSAKETDAIRESLYLDRKKNEKNLSVEKNYRFVTWHDMTDFIKSAADWCATYQLFYFNSKNPTAACSHY